MKILLAALVSYMFTSWWACLLGGITALVIVSVVFIPPAIVSVLIADAQREKHRWEDQWMLKSGPTHTIDR